LAAVERMQEIFGNHKEVFFHREVLCRSWEGLEQWVLTISSQNLRLEKEKESYEVFDGQPGVSTCSKFEARKPVILLSSRVHPGETPASHALNGVLKLLLDTKSEASKILLRNFVFKIVPSLNPDGVFHGHFRKDRLLQNLNRFYKRPDPKKQPGPYYLRGLMDYFSQNHRLVFYCDFHAHSGIRNCFLYGNHCNFVRQVEARLFSKILGQLSEGFIYEDCDFSAYQMRQKEKTEEVGKEGCARVMGYYQGLLAHSYTLEMTYHSIIDPSTKKEIKPLELSDLEDVGKQLCHALIYQFGLNRYLTKATEVPLEKMDFKVMRTEIANAIKKLFILDENRLESKVKDIHNLVHAKYYDKIFKDQMLF
jgi:hypothetical protein